MKRTLLAFSIMAFFALSYFIISCTHEAPVSASNNCVHLAFSATADTTNNSYADGTITASATGGTGYMFSLDNGPAQDNGTFTGLAAGQTYDLSVTTSEGCNNHVSITIDSVQGSTSNPCASFGLSTMVTQPTQASPNGGSIAANASGASGPYTYSIDGTNFVSNGTFSNLGAGSYTVSAKSADGCTKTKSVTLSVNSNPCGTITVTATSVNPTSGNNGSITASATGGTAPYTYSIDGTNFVSSGTFSNLAAGSYTITAKTADGCTGTKSVTLTSSANLVSFSRDIQPIIAQKCGSANISCHNHSNNWTTYSDIAGGTAGTPWPSHLKTLIGRCRSTTGLQASGSHNMPPSSSTTWTTFAQGLFTTWVNQGFLNN